MCENVEDVKFPIQMIFYVPIVLTTRRISWIFSHAKARHWWHWWQIDIANFNQGPRTHIKFRSDILLIAKFFLILLFWFRFSLNCSFELSCLSSVSSSRATDIKSLCSGNVNERSWRWRKNENYVLIIFYSFYSTFSFSCKKSMARDGENWVAEAARKSSQLFFLIVFIS